VLELLDHGTIMMLATRSGALEPECTYAVGARPLGSERAVCIYVPEATAAASLANLRDNGQGALTIVQPTTHRSLQLKGTLRGERPADRPEDGAYLASQREKFVSEFGRVGVPRWFCVGFTSLPVLVVEMDVRDVFVQTPGPTAGRRLGAGEAR
jgi:hypothetical protein